MKRVILILMILLLGVNAYGAPVRPNNYVTDQTIDPDENNENENALYNYLTAGVDTILDNSIVGADLNSAIAITSSGNMTFSGTTAISGATTLSGATTMSSTWTDLGTVTTVDINGGTVDGITSLTAGGALDIGAYGLTALTFTSDQATGTAPFTVASTTTVANLAAASIDGFDPTEAATTNKLAGIQLFTANGTFTVPTSVTVVYVTMCGGGGGGGGGKDGIAPGYGGGGGACVVNIPYPVTPESEYTVVVGAAGAAGAVTAAGGDGGDSTFDGTLTANKGGGGGTGGGSAGVGGSADRDGGAGSVSNAGQLGQIAGGAGGDGAGSYGGGGGASGFGVGGQGGIGSGHAGYEPVSGYGGGGGGGGAGDQVAGGVGKIGIVLVQW